MFTPFQNEPYVNFSDERPRRKMEEALARVSQEMGRTYPAGNRRSEDRGHAQDDKLQSCA